MMQFHALSFHFWVEIVEPSFIISHDVEQELLLLEACP
jgi:hypothetical protein